ncbi:MAG: hypothetical protein A2Y38_02840 [Spirochaetes bacterium GWB1_59_5]|nr:MAG: hypothetical protein A2Y38_02840 [Spirochaetes bacterium GWB1_59_5]
MPMYEYRCSVCGHEFEKITKVNDPNPPCPAVQDDSGTAPRLCGNVTLKQISRTNFALKGSGWGSDSYS